VTGQEAGGGSNEGCGAFQTVGGTGGGRPAGLCLRAVIREKGGRGSRMHPRSPVDAHRQGRGGTGQREVLLRRLVRLMRLVLLEELTVQVVVLGLILEVLQMLPLPVMMVRGRRRDSVLLAHDAAAGSLWLVDEGSHHGGGMYWGGGEAWLRVLCDGVGVGERLTFGVRVGIASTSGRRHLDALPWLAFPG